MSDDTELLDFSAAVTFEHETKPPYTVRLDFAATDFEAANKTAVFRAFKMRPKGISAVMRGRDRARGDRQPRGGQAEGPPGN